MIQSRLQFAWNLFIWIIGNLQIFFTPKSKESIQIISASDNSHQKSLMNLLDSITHFEPNAKVTVFDLGMDSRFLDQLFEKFPSVEFRNFPFENYPSYYDIKLEAGSYAWKPAAIELAKPWNGMILWLDAGNLLTGPLSFLRKTVKKYKFFSPYSVGSIHEWTHPKVISSIGIDSEVLKERNLAANVICFSSSDEEATNLIEKWIYLSKIKELIAPEGSSRLNHRQDQSLLTVLAYKTGLVTYGNLAEFPRRVFRILVHQDVD
jgi:hypothetical protein